MTPRSAGLMNFAAFQLGWFVCILSAARGVVWIGPAVVVTLFAVQLLLVPALRPRLRVMLSITFVGVIVDSVLGLSGLLVFKANPWPIPVCPPWLCALWLSFASILPSSLAWFARYPKGALLAGAIAGPLSYQAGVRFGALTFGPSPWLSLATLAALWAAMLPLSLILANDPAEASTTG